MNKPLLIVAAAAATLSIAYVGTARHVGSVIEAEVAHFETSLAQLDDVRVYRIAYERRLFDGTLHYDLAFSPIPGDPIHDFLRNALGENADLSFRADGSIAVRHGPWLGGETGFGLARMEGGLQLPAQLREHLPQYPGQRPLVEAQGVFGFDRNVDLHLRGIDYRGKLVDPASDITGNLTFAGLTGRLGFDSDADWLKTTLRLDELALELTTPEQGSAAIRGIALDADLTHVDAGFWIGPTSLTISEIALADDGAVLHLADLSLAATGRAASGRDGAARHAVGAHGGIASTRFEITESGERTRLLADTLALEFDAIREWPALWLGRANLTLASLEGDDGDTALKLSTLRLNSDTALRGELIDQTIRYESGPIVINGAELAGASVQMSLNGLRGDVVDELTRALDRHRNDPDALAGAEFQAVLQSALERSLAETVSLNLAPISISVQAPDDLSARIGANFDGAPGIALDDLPQLIERLELSAVFTATTPALKALTRIAVAAEHRAAGTVADEAALAAEVEMRFDTMMDSARQLPFLIVTPDQIRSEASVKAGKLALNGEALGDLDNLALLGAALGSLFGDDDAASDPAPSALAPNFDAEPMYETVRLAADFDPDPYVVELMAGGSTALDGGLGEDCFGHVNGDQPDVVLEYSAGAFPLFIYAESLEDTLLAVRAPDGHWHCNDDGPDRGVDPTIAFDQPPSGTYHIWVGTFGAAPVEAQLMLSEIDPTSR